jgi:uncharacterized protein (DUF362 family)
MRAKVGIYRNSRLGYSTDWIWAENYPEKESVRALSRLMGQATGNLFRDVVQPGHRVVIKPNWVLDRNLAGFDIYSVITHPALLRAVVDLVYEAMGGEGRIIIADAPQWDCAFDHLLQVTQVQKISEYYWEKYRFDLPLRDLREVRCVGRHEFIKAADRVKLAGDPEGYAIVDLGATSAFVGMPSADRLYGADYDRRETIRHHCEGRHEYRVSKTILGADVVIHVPKLKVHKKVGVTLNCKGMVGINGNKNWVAHFRIGPPSVGGDEFPDYESPVAKGKSRVRRVLIDRLLSQNSPSRERAFDVLLGCLRKCRKVLGPVAAGGLSVDSGNWHGNDTAWRMTADLARVVLFADRNGKMQETAQRRFFSLVDGIVGGEADGPLAPTPKAGGVLLGGDNLLAVDLVGTRLMGFDWQKVRYLRWLVTKSPQLGVESPSRDIEIFTNTPEWHRLMQDRQIHDLNFEPHSGWKGNLEITRINNVNAVEPN